MKKLPWRHASLKPPPRHKGVTSFFIQWPHTTDHHGGRHTTRVQQQNTPHRTQHTVQYFLAAPYRYHHSGKSSTEVGQLSGEFKLWTWHQIKIKLKGKIFYGRFAHLIIQTHTQRLNLSMYTSQKQNTYLNT